MLETRKIICLKLFLPNNVISKLCFLLFIGFFVRIALSSLFIALDYRDHQKSLCPIKFPPFGPFVRPSVGSFVRPLNNDNVQLKCFVFCLTQLSSESNLVSPSKQTFCVTFEASTACLPYWLKN
jgi:hypothetical protein